MKKLSLVVLSAAALALSHSTASAQIVAQDPFDTYTNGSIVGQTGKTVDETGGDILGFGSVTGGTATTWQGGGSNYSSGVLTNPSVGRTGRAFDSSVSSIDTGTVLVSFNVSFAANSFGPYEAFELDDTPTDGTVNTISLYSQGATYNIRYATPTGDINSNADPVGTNDGGFHTFLLAVDFDTDTVTAYEDPASISSIPSSGGASVAFDPSFRLNAITLATFGTGSASIDGLTAEMVPEPSTWAMMLGGVALLLFVRRARTARA